jgi:hypothetical protein
MEAASRRGVTAVLVALALFAVGRPLESWLGGLVEGAAIALLLLGVLAISRARRNQAWLPGRDGGER